jgi:hypothetical protein
LFQPGLDIAGHLAQKAQALVANNCGAFGPHVLVLSDEDDHDLSVYAVIQGNLIYEVKSIIEALDICMKSSFVFGLMYPPPARSAWTFIQQLVFELYTDYDIQSSRLLERVSFFKSN